MFKIITRKQFNSLPAFFQWSLVAILLALIATIWSITINPFEFVNFNRDRQRIKDLKNLSQLIQYVEVQRPQALLGKKLLVYVSLPDKDQNCANWNLPPLPFNYQYHCSAPESYRRIDGDGWLPIDFTKIQVNLSVLPIDPLNGKKSLDPFTGEERILFYQYIKGSFGLKVFIETSKMAGQLTEVGNLALLKEFESFAGKETAPFFKIILFEGSTMIGNDLKSTIAILSDQQQREISERIKEIILNRALALTGNSSSEAKLIIDNFLAQNFPSLYKFTKESPKIKLPEIVPVNRQESNNGQLSGPINSQQSNNGQLSGSKPVSEVDALMILLSENPSLKQRSSLPPTQLRPPRQQAPTLSSSSKKLPTECPAGYVHNPNRNCCSR